MKRGIWLRIGAACALILAAVPAAFLAEHGAGQLRRGRPGDRLRPCGIWLCHVQVQGRECPILFLNGADDPALAGDFGAKLLHFGWAESAGFRQIFDTLESLCPGNAPAGKLWAFQRLLFVLQTA